MKRIIFILLGVLLLAASGQAQEVTLMAMFPFDDTDFIMNDHSDFNQTAKALGDVSSHLGEVIGRGSLRLDNDPIKAPKSRIFIYDHSTLDLKESFTIEVWFKVNSIGANWDDYNSSPRILSKAGDPANFSNYAIDLELKDERPILVCRFHNGRDWNEVKMGDADREPTVKLGQWYGVIWQYNQAENSQTLFVFDQRGAGGGLNPAWAEHGLVFWEKVTTVGMPRVSDKPLFLGHSGGVETTGWFDGWLDNLHIYKGIKTYDFMNQLDLPMMTLRSLNIQARHIDKSTIQLTWDKTSGTDTYRIYRSNSANFAPNDKFFLKNCNFNEFRDDSADERHIYYYRIGVINSSGDEYFVSDEITALLVPPIKDAKIIPFRTSMKIEWKLPSPVYELDQIVGYNIYRSEASSISDPGVVPKLIATLPKVESFSDGSLTPGRTYYYRIAPRSRDGAIGMLSEEFGVSTDPQGVYSQFANIDVLIAIYTSTAGGRISNVELDRIKRGFEIGREFFWRHSQARLNLNLNYLVIDDFKSESFFPTDGNLWAEFVEDDFFAYGVLPRQYGLVISVYPPVGEGRNFGAMKIMGETGYAFLRYPFQQPYVYAAGLGQTDFGAAWNFVYYVQHTLNGICYQGQMWRADRMYDHIQGQGEAYDYLAAALQDFTGYLSIQPQWGRLLETIDEDQDGLPDADERIPMDEKKFDSRPNLADTDADGLTDLQEYCRGLYESSDPKKVDTDGDAFADDTDAFPLQAIRTSIIKKEVEIDGHWDKDWQMLIDDLYFAQDDRFKADIYATWSADGLNLAMVSNQKAPVLIDINCQDEGWYHGRDNLQVQFDPETDKFLAHALDATTEARRLHKMNTSRDEAIWDDDVYYVNWRERLVDESKFRIQSVRTSSGYLTEILIPKNEALGFEPKSGYEFEMRVYFEGVNASAFEPYRFVKFTMK